MSYVKALPIPLFTLIKAVAIPLFTLMGTLCALSSARKLGGGT